MAKKTKKPGVAEAPLMNLQTGDAASAFSPLRGERSFPSDRALQLGFVDLGEEHSQPELETSYPVVSASSRSVGRIPCPVGPYRRLHLDLYDFFLDDPPGFPSKGNGGLMKVVASTKNPQDLLGSMTDAAFVTAFSQGEGTPAVSFSHRGGFRNIIVQDWITLSVQLYELGTKGAKSYGKIRSVLDGIPDFESLDVLKGLSTLNLTTQIFDGIVRTVGKKADGPFWGELPILEFEPTPGGAFLRTGIYLLTEKRTSKGAMVELASLEYKNGRILSRNGTGLPNHLLFGVSVAAHPPAHHP